MTLASSREALLEAFVLPRRVFAPREESSLLQQQLELKAAANFGMWKSVTLLASQMVEAFLAKRMAQRQGGTAPTSRATFGQLINAAKAEGVLPDYDSPVLGVQSISATLLIRNWAAHYDLWSEYPTELRGTQAIALMLCALESLCPNDDRWRTSTVDDRGRGWRRRPPHQAVEQLQALKPSDPLPASIVAAPEDFCDYVVMVGSLRTTVGLGDVLLKRQLGIQPLRSALERRFGYLALHATRANDKYLMQTLALLKRCGLQPQAQVFAILLPFDAQILAHLLRTRHPMQVAFYVKQCYKAEPSLFEAKATGRGAADLIPTFWHELTGRTEKLSTITKILQFMPPRLLARLMAAAPLALLAARVEQTTPRFAAMLLYSVRNDVLSHDRSLTAVRDTLIEAVASNLRQAPLEQLHNVPVYFRLAKLTNEWAAVQVAREILGWVMRATPSSDADWSAVRRSVWDCYIFIPASAADALGVAQLLVSKYGEMNWHLLCLRGMLELARSGSRPDATRRTSYPIEVDIPAGADRWQIYLVFLAVDAICQRRGTALPEASNRRGTSSLRCSTQIRADYVSTVD